MRVTAASRVEIVLDGGAASTLESVELLQRATVTKADPRKRLRCRGPTIPPRWGTQRFAWHVASHPGPWGGSRSLRPLPIGRSQPLQAFARLLFGKFTPIDNRCDDPLRLGTNIDGTVIVIEHVSLFSQVANASSVPPLIWSLEQGNDRASRCNYSRFGKVAFTRSGVRSP